MKSFDLKSIDFKSNDFMPIAPLSTLLVPWDN